MSHLPIVLSVLPFAIFIVCLLFIKTTLLRSSVAALATFMLLAAFYWQMLPSLFLVSYIKGFFVAFDIFIIIFGAIFFLSVMQRLGVIKNISYYLEHFSRDYRVQIIILAWFFENFIEGTAGFGTPMAVVAPLLVGLGLPVITALVVALLGNSASVVFGAAGTPIRTGFAGLDVAAVPYLSALINCVGLIVPIFMLWIITAGRENRRKEFLDGLPFAIWSGVAFVVPTLLAAAFFGQELPTIIGSVVGLLLVMASTKLGILTPKNILSLKGKDDLQQTMSAFKAFLPYGLLVFFLVAGKLLLTGISIPFFIMTPLSFNMFNPGFAFLIAGIVALLIWKEKGAAFAASAVAALRGTLSPFLVIIFMSSLVQLMIYSGQNNSGLPAAITLVAKIFEANWLPFFTPFVGAFGSFITGSATISNIMFGNFFNTAAQFLGFNPSLILSLGVVGASAGNMIALPDMLAAEAVVGVKNQERQILKGVFIPCATYLLLAGCVGMLMAYLR